MRKVFLDELPTYIKGRHKGCVDWDKCIGYTIRFIYEEIEDEVIIANSLDKYLYIKYKDYDVFKIQKESFSRANIGILIKYDFRKYYLNVGDKLISDTRNLYLTDQKIKIRKDGYRQEWFKYTCNKCGWTDGWMEKHKLFRGDNCACCSGSVVVEEINSVYVKAPWMIKYFQNTNDAKKVYVW